MDPDILTAINKTKYYNKILKNGEGIYVERF